MWKFFVSEIIQINCEMERMMTIYFLYLHQVKYMNVKLKINEAYIEVK